DLFREACVKPVGPTPDPAKGRLPSRSASALASARIARTDESPPKPAAGQGGAPTGRGSARLRRGRMRTG
ncbi:hypothetical protein ACLBYC_04605, partial [Methylobacterium brachiatum]